ncbi:SDR family oxidoreductase [Streptomyces sp. NBC_01190]|uniref:SDR family oxidoreductase n=1 Tax=Streptomyces sp. NBC_01190 TaxID=2903767 RepID=UPI003864C8D7|nr:SDR family oxidoreductase [Streptomyces sp. NBC_01190]
MKSKRVVIIGGTSGLGFAVARAAAAEGASVVVASRTPAGVRQAVSELGADAGGESVDVADEADVRGFFERVGAFDHLVYTAGEPLINGSLAATDIAAARRFFEIRYFGALAAAKYGAPRIRPGGSIVLTSGIASNRPQGRTVVVSSVLSAIEGLTRALAADLAPIRVNAVVPAIIRTEMWRGLADAARESLYESVAKGGLLDRVGEPADVAEAFLYLMRNKHTTGSSLTIDAGTLLK